MRTDGRAVTFLRLPSDRAAARPSLGPPTLLLTKGVHPKIVSEMLGHSSVAITLDVYSHVIPGLGDAAALAMEDVLGK